MKHVILLVLSFLVFNCLVRSQEMGFEEYNPKSTLVVPENPIEKAKFPFVDIHSHHFRMETQDLSKLIAEMDSHEHGPHGQPQWWFW